MLERLAIGCRYLPFGAGAWFSYNFLSGVNVGTGFEYVNVSAFEEA